jgi:fluoride exporter
MPARQPRSRPRRNRGDTPDPRIRGDDRLPVDPDLDPDDPSGPSAERHPVAHVQRARQHDVLVAIAAGGFIGSLGRYELGLAWVAAPGRLPWATLTVNTSGAFLLGLILTVLLSRIRPPRLARPFLCVGVLGGWTTMSTFAVESDLLVRGGYVGMAVLYVATTVVVGLSVAWIGSKVGQALPARWVQWLSR